MGSVNLNLAPKSRVWSLSLAAWAADEFLNIWAELIGGGPGPRSELDMREIEPGSPASGAGRIRLIDNEPGQNK